MKKPTSLSVFIAAVAILAGATTSALAHCQVPCGIYDDHARLALIAEHITTIEKAMAQINELAGKTDAQSNQQLARWVLNKETHATEIQEIAQAYFLAQRIKFPGPDGDREKYNRQLETLHQLIVYAMKCKQTADAENTARLKQALKDFHDAYHVH